MNILSVTNALKGIKLKELDDEFQIEIMRSLNQALPDGVCPISNRSVLRWSDGNNLYVCACTRGLFI